MGYHMRRQDRALDDDAITAILKKGKYIVLSLCRDNEPYIVTLSYGFDSVHNCLYLHSANDGLKLDFISANRAVCGTVIIDSGYVDGECGHQYETVVVRGQIHVADTLDEKRSGVDVILNHLEMNPLTIAQKALKTEGAYRAITVLRLDISEMTGKKGR